jgi:hypothetical protein
LSRRTTLNIPNDLGVIEHPAPNVEPGDVIVREDGREALVTARVETDGGPLAPLLEVAPSTPSLAGLPDAPHAQA